MTLPNDVTRCSGFDCPMRANCLRHTDIPESANGLSWFAEQPWEWHPWAPGPKCEFLIKGAP